MQIKYRVHEVAKDLNVDKKEIIDLLDHYFSGEQHKHATALTEEELNVVFEHYTQQNQVSDFNRYFASKDEPPVAAAKEEPKKETKAPAKKEESPKTEEKVPPKEEPKTELKEDPKPVEFPVQEAEKPVQPEPVPEQNVEQTQAQAEAPKKEEPKPVEQKQPVMQKEMKNESNSRPNRDGDRRENRRPDNRGDRNNDRRDNNRRDGNRDNARNGRPDNRNNDRRENNNNHTPASKPAPKAPAAPVAPVEPVEKERTVRHVNTRTVEVNLDKYNEHYEEIAPQAASRSDNQQRKQKLKQKSQAKNKAKFSTKRETEAEKLQRLALERARKQQLKVLIPDEITVSELASRLKVTVTDVIKKLMLLGVMASQNEVIDFDTASLVAMEYNAKIEKEVIVTIEEQLIHDEEDNSEDLVERSPVVVVMGHVDHGKTSLLDRIRNAHVTDTEAGGITQHIGAYRVKVDGHYITFLDTPGHEAFTAMRARGAAVTDIAVLVVAADDGIMPQTVEAINHAKAAGVSIIVAINKMDKPHADPERVKQELTEYELVPEEWGGDIICVPVSAATGMGIDDLLENINLVAEMQELKANPNRLAKGTVIEARLDKGRGPVATLLVQNGTLHTGDVLIAGTSVGRVRQMLNDRGQIVTEAGPSIPVEITGMTEVPAAGDIFNAVEDERLARELVEQRRAEQKEEQFKSYQKVTLDNLFSQIAEGEMKELPLIVKADVQGTAEAVKQSLEKLTTDEVRVRVIHTGVGAINSSDVMLANASNAIVIGFNVRPDPTAKAEAEQQSVELRMYRIIYDAIEEVKSAMKGMLAPKTREVDLGRIEVRQVYKITGVGAVAGCYVLDGKITRNSQIRIVRDGIIVAVDQIASLKRFKDDAKEVAQGYECGVTLAKFNDIKEGDIYESFIVEEYRED